MNSTVLFSERQRFTQWWLWVILIGINSIALFGFFKQIIFGQTFGDRPMSNYGLVIFLICMVLFVLFFIKMGLKTQITQEGIAIQFIPFHSKFTHYKWSDISRIYIRKYSPLKEFGGWGIRYGSDGMAYNVSGNMGIQLEFFDKRKILIGTNKPEEVQKVIQSIENLHQNK